MTSKWLKESLRLIQEDELSRILDNPSLAPLVGSALAATGRGVPNFDSLLAIPSETTIDERALLRAFFEKMWSGRGHVLEIGPFMGGTTRAIATGMMANPNRSGDSKLCTFDRFGHYKADDGLYDFAYSLVETGQLQEDELRRLCQGGSFLDLFHAIHDDTDYGDLIVTTAGELRDAPAAVVQGDTLELPEGFVCDAVFIDGCKSWYGTKEFAMNVLPHLNPGCPLIFQDYGWHTTFWVSALIHLIPNAFELFANIDMTYAFRLTRPLTVDEVDRCFPDSVEDMGINRTIGLFTETERLAVERSDVRGIVSSRLHLAAGLAYLGSTADCIGILDTMLANPVYRQFHGQIGVARRQPTYRPDGGIFLSEPIVEKNDLPLTAPV